MPNHKPACTGCAENCYLRGDGVRCGAPLPMCPYLDERLAMYYTPPSPCVMGRTKPQPR